jgi:hypothetical protein
VGGFRFEIPFEEWWLDTDDRPCIQTSPPAFMGVLLGDVFFRALVVQFDLTHPTIPVDPPPHLSLLFPIEVPRICLRLTGTRIPGR